jgi:ABC-type dipeptide/oligopeptide/nickel transport system permease component
MSKLRFAVRRLFQMVLTLLAVGSVLFLLFRLIPGNPTSYIVSGQMSPEAKQKLIQSFGLNEPLHTQYFKYIENLATLDLGQSFQTQQPVTEMILTFLPNTLVLMLTAFLIAYPLGIGLGILAGWYRGTRFERVTVIVALFARSLPAFWIGLLALWVLGATYGVIPMSGMSSIGSETDFLSLSFLYHLITPAAVLAFYFMGYPLLIMRSSMLDVLNEDFIEICRAKGLSERAVLLKHGARNALLPIVTASAIALGYSIAGSVLIETVFSWPGLGRAMVRAVLRRDYPVAQGAFLMLATAVIVMNFLADLTYSYLDPRVTYD